MSFPFTENTSAKTNRSASWQNSGFGLRFPIGNIIHEPKKLKNLQHQMKPRDTVPLSQTQPNRMKTCLKNSVSRLVLPVLTLAALGYAYNSPALDLKVDSTKNWIGYMNVFNLDTDGGAYQFGSVWAQADLPAYYGGPSNVLGPSQLTFTANTSQWLPLDPFWVTNGVGNKKMQAVYYVETKSLLGQHVTFSGTVNSNTFVAGYQTIAFVKVLDPGSGWSVAYNAEQVIGNATTSFSVNLDLSAVTNQNLVPQYGFQTTGHNVNPLYVASTGLVSVVVQNPDPLFTTQPVGTTVAAPANLTLTSAAVTTSGTVNYQWKKDGVNVVNGGVFSGADTATLTITGGTSANSGDYTVEATSPAGSTVSSVATITILPIVITSNPTDLRLPVGATASFSGSATSTGSLQYRWFKISGGTTNVLLDGGRISGATTTNLTISNVQLGDTASYVLRFNVGSDILYGTPAKLSVKTPADFANLLENPGFENGKADESPWFRYESTSPTFGAVQDATDTYFGGGNVNIYQGSYVSFTSPSGTWSGIYQDAPVAPGQIFKGDMWFYNASGDPIPGPPLATNECYLEIQFRNAGDQVINQYVSTIFSSTLPANTWVNLAATNGGDYTQVGAPKPANGTYLVAPAGAAKARFQFTIRDLGGSFGAGSVYYDNASLMLKVPVTITMTPSGSSYNLSWTSQGGTSYQVVYKDNLSDLTWTPIGAPVAGTGGAVSAPVPAPGTQRFYAVLTL